MPAQGAAVPTTPKITDAVNMCRHLANTGKLEGLTRSGVEAAVARHWAAIQGVDFSMVRVDCQDAVTFLIKMREIEYAPHQSIKIHKTLVLDDVPARDAERTYTREDFAREIRRCGDCLSARTLDPAQVARELERLTGLTDLIAYYDPVSLSTIINSEKVRAQVAEMVEAASDGMTSRDVWRRLGDVPEYAAVPLQSLSGYVGAALCNLDKHGVLDRCEETPDGAIYRRTGQAPHRRTGLNLPARLPGRWCDTRTEVEIRDDDAVLAALRKSKNATTEELEEDVTKLRSTYAKPRGRVLKACLARLHRMGRLLLVDGVWCSAHVGTAQGSNSERLTARKMASCDRDREAEYVAQQRRRIPINI